MLTRRGLMVGALAMAALVMPGIARAYSPAVEQYRPIAEAACAQYGCSSDYLLGVMECESHGDSNAVGPRGELGVMQIDPRYWGVMSTSDGIYFAAQHLTAGDIYWACQ